MIDVEAARHRLASTPPLELARQLASIDAPQGAYIRARALMLLGRDAEAVSTLRELASRFPQDRLLQVEMTLAEGRTGERDPIGAANRIWDEAETLPDPPRARLAAAALAVGKTKHGTESHRFALERLSESAETVLTTSPNDPQALALGALANGDLGRTDRAVELLERLHSVGVPPWPWVWQIDSTIAGRTHDERRRLQSWRRSELLIGRRGRLPRYLILRAQGRAPLIAALVWGAAVLLDNLWLLAASLVPLGLVIVGLTLCKSPSKKLLEVGGAILLFIALFVLFHAYG